MSCQKVSGGAYDAINKDVSVGLEIFRSIAVFRTTLWNTILGTGQVVCRLAQTKEKPKYKTLTLAFGMNDQDASNESQIRLSLYKDGNAYGYKDVIKGEKSLWQVDITGTRSLALEAECIRPVTNATGNCPQIYFFEDTLK
jgi:hypothetical protein